MYPISTICTVVNGKLLQSSGDAVIAELVYDSRRIAHAGSALFFALVTAHADGHAFLSDAYRKGIRNFVVSRETDESLLPESTVIRVADTLAALQALASFHRGHFSLPVIGITGSNGKTIVKEWLFQLLQPDHRIVRSPRSFNSQIGVPLSIWPVNGQHTLALIEAGISQAGEMERLQPIIRPTIGVFTNLGEAHSAGFSSPEEKLHQKLLLFTDAELLIGPHGVLGEGTFRQPLMTWGDSKDATVQIKEVLKEEERTGLTLVYGNRNLSFYIPFTDEASITNAVTCCCVLLHLGYGEAVIQERFPQLHAVNMRLQLLHGINGCTVLNDVYSADLTSLHIALSFLRQQHAARQRTVILSDFFESGKAEEELYRSIAAALQEHGLHRVIGIGEGITNWLPRFLPAGDRHRFYATTEEFIRAFRSTLFRDEVILVKGARRFGFERIVQLFETKVHGTQLEVNLDAVAHNLKKYSRLLRPGVLVMAMVKAFAYGSGGAEIAGLLQYHNVQYLGVAYADEGVELRKAGVSIPIMIMNAEEASFSALADHNLQPVLFSCEQLQEFAHFLSEAGLEHYPVHIEIETGMNRLGFAPGSMQELGRFLAGSSQLRVASVFSHLASSEDPSQDSFTQEQAKLFTQAAGELQALLPYPFLRHISNSAAIVRHPSLQLDMVRLGIGLYGVEGANNGTLHLQAAATLRSTIAQLKYLKKGETVSYNRRGRMERDSVIATVRIGYADGYSRRFSNGTGKMSVKGNLVPVVGTVCMDMTMVDVTDVPGVREGDEVIIFGPGLPVQELARWAGTISYEILTAVSQRVKRIYFQE